MSAAATTCGPRLRERRLRAMGTDAHLLALGAPPGALDAACRRLARLEAAWSRFLASSEISRCNAAGGRAVAVSGDTFGLVTRAVTGWLVSAGRYDPTVVHALAAHGYDRSFELVSAGGEPSGSVEPRPSPGCDGIVLDPSGATVTLPVGVGLDPGGIGKGYAADLLCDDLLDAGAEGACVNLGGDLRAAGAAPAGGWTVAVDDSDAGAVATVRLVDGALATSARTRRAWRHAGRPVHHLLDPTTGLSADSGLRSATVLATHGWLAEVLAKAVFLTGLSPAAQLLAGAGAEALVVDDGGVVAVSPGWARRAA
jgi:thiamine biosynthesis lipoprotein